jgi:hypothetical protein
LHHPIGLISVVHDPIRQAKSTEGRSDKDGELMAQFGKVVDYSVVDREDVIPRKGNIYEGPGSRRIRQCRESEAMAKTFKERDHIRLPRATICVAHQ